MAYSVVVVLSMTHFLHLEWKPSNVFLRTREHFPLTTRLLYTLIVELVTVVPRREQKNDRPTEQNAIRVTCERQNGSVTLALSVTTDD